MHRQNVVVLVEDDESIRKVLRDLLHFTGKAVVECQDSNEALTFFDRHAGAISTMIIDYAMPGLNGIAVAREVRRTAPWINVLVISGHRLIETECREHGFAFLAKPFGTADILKALERFDTTRKRPPKRATGLYPASAALPAITARVAGA